MFDPSSGGKFVVFCRAVMIAAACAALSSCGYLFDDPPKQSRSSTTANAVSSPGHHIVKPGDTLSSIAGRYGLSMGDVAAANRLQVPYALSVGQFLILPQPNFHQVRRGENLYRISVNYGVDMAALAEANDIKPPYTIYPGQRLLLPARAATEEVPPVPETTALAELNQESNISLPPLEARTSITSSPLPDAAIVAVAPAPVSEARAAPPRRPRVEAVPAPAVAPPPPAPAPPTEPVQAGSSLPRPPASLLAPATESSPSASAAAPPPPLAKGGFLWPVRGDILSTYGPNPGGLHNDGINIAAPRGTPVVASQSGIVIYAGNEIEGYGRLLIIKHADGWSTAYGHNDILLVGRGDSVARGETVARVGSTGDVETPQLHFEIRKQTKAVNPFDKLVSSSAVRRVNQVAGQGVRQDPE